MRPFLIILILYLLPGTPARAETVQLQGCYENRQWTPYLLGTGEEIPYAPGIFIELLDKAAPVSGFAVKYIRRPWKRCLALLQRNRVDLVIGGSYLQERDAYSAYPMTAEGKPDSSRALQHSAYFLYTLNDSPVHWDGQTLSGLTRPLGVDLGYSSGSVLRKRGLEIQEVNTLKNGFRLLKNGRLDGYVTFRDRVLQYGDISQENIRQHSVPFIERSYYLIASDSLYEGYRSRVEKLWNRLRELRVQLGDQLRKKYKGLQTH